MEFRGVQLGSYSGLLAGYNNADRLALDPVSRQDVGARRRSIARQMGLGAGNHDVNAVTPPLSLMLLNLVALFKYGAMSRSGLGLKRGAMSGFASTALICVV